MSWLSNSTDYHNATADITLLCQDQVDNIMLWMGVAILCFVFGFPAAVAILMDLFQKRRKGIPFSPIEVFIFNVTVMDGVYLVFLQPETYNYIDGRNMVFQTFISFLYSFNLCGRPLFMTCMCLDCYTAVLHPVIYRAKKSLTPRVLMAVGVWIVTIIYGCYFAIVRDEHLTNIILILVFVWTLPVIGFCDSCILWTLNRSSPGGRSIHPQKKKVLQIVISNTVITLISYVPPLTTVLVSHFLSLNGNTFHCLMVIPVMRITVVAHIVAHLLHLNNVGKLEWLKCWKQK